MSDCILTDEQDGILLVTLNRPDSLNSLNSELIQALKETWQVAADSRIKGVVITGSGRGFCAGADLRGPGAGASKLRDLTHSFNPHVLGLTALRKVVICAVNGPAAGAGLSLACSGDIRIASENAVFVAAFSRIGSVPDAGASYLLPKLIGYSRAFDFLCSGNKIDAETALQWGLVNEVVPASRLVERAMERAQAIAKMPGSAVELTKALLIRASTATLAEMLDLESSYQALALAHPDRAKARQEAAQQVLHKGQE
jgi:2-(1,2-epoxy-1,2-dihydrophenyl)acetyl-CoA isomerase